MERKEESKREIKDNGKCFVPENYLLFICIVFIPFHFLNWFYFFFLLMIEILQTKNEKK